MNDRQKKLQDFKKKKAKKLIVADGQPFIDALEEKIKEFRSLFDKGLDLHDDALLMKLQEVGALSDDLTSVKKALDSLEIPNTVKVTGLDSLLKSLNELKKKEFDFSQLKQITKTIEKLTQKVEQIKLVERPLKQEAENYLPFRRVIKIKGLGLIFDDSYGSGASAGGGSNTPILNGSVPVVNPDGSNVGGTFTNDGTFATPAKQDTGNTSLASIDTKIDALTTPSDTQPISGPVAVVSAGNSSTTPLSGGATFTGAWEDISNYDFLEITLYTDVNSATNGAKLLLSTDGGTTSEKVFQNTITAVTSSAFSYRIPCTAFTHFKIIYTNGAGAQSIFHLRTIYQQGSADIIAPLGATVSAVDSGGLTRSLVAGQLDTGVIQNASFNSSGYQRMDIAAVDVDVPIKALTGLNIGQQTITSTASQITASATNRKTVSIKALVANTEEIYLGTTSGVTTTNGYELAAGDAVEFDLVEGQAIYAISPTSSQGICKAEIS